MTKMINVIKVTGGVVCNVTALLIGFGIFFGGLGKLIEGDSKYMTAKNMNKATEVEQQLVKMANDIHERMKKSKENDSEENEAK